MCCTATKPMHHSYWTCAPKPRSPNYWAYVTTLLKPVLPRACALKWEKPPQWEACMSYLETSVYSPQLEKSPLSNKDPAQPKINLKIPLILRWSLYLKRNQNTGLLGSSPSYLKGRERGSQDENYFFNVSEMEIAHFASTDIQLMRTSSHWATRSTRRCKPSI